MSIVILNLLNIKYKYKIEVEYAGLKEHAFLTMGNPLPVADPEDYKK